MRMLRATQTRQPSGAARIARGNPLGRNMAYAVSARDAYDAVSGRPVGRRTGTLLIPHYAGMTVVADGANGSGFNASSGRTLTNAWSVLFDFDTRSNGFGHPGVLLAIAGGSGNGYSISLPGTTGSHTVNLSLNFSTAISASVASGERHVVAIVSRPGRHQIFANGKLVGSSTNGNGFVIDFNNVAQAASNGLRLLAVSDDYWTDDACVAACANPYQIFQGPNRLGWFFDVGGVTVYRPGSDIIVNGWTATPGGTLASCVDDLTLDRADFITSPNLTDPATLGWATALPAGSYDIAVDADRIGASGQVRIVCLDAGGAAVGTSSWQSLTGTAATYTLSVTTSALSTQFRIEVQA